MYIGLECTKNESRFDAKYCANMGTREKEEGSSKRNMGRTVERERCEMGFRTWAEAERIAIDRKRWKDKIKALYSMLE